MALTITDNSPSAGYIAWSGLIISYKEVDYNVNDGNSNKKYLWWDLDNPNDLQESDTEPTMSDDDCIVFINDNGTHKMWGFRSLHGSMIEDGTIGASKLEGNAAVPSGAIMMWSGQIANIPSGWYLCDGNNGTPDLRNRFIVGAGSSYGVGATGGAASVTLTTDQIPAHTHGSAGGHSHSYQSVSPTGASGNYAGDYGRHIASLPASSTGVAGGHTHSSVGGGNSHENRPPYYALAFIMKV